jgi:hypothetical protein
MTRRNEHVTAGGRLDDVRRISSRISFVKSRIWISNILVNHNPEDIKMLFKKGIGEMVKKTLRGKLLSENKKRL